MKELLLEAPAWLAPTADGRLVGAVRVANYDLAAWRCRCRLEASSGERATLELGTDGTGRLDLPARLAGPLLVALELTDPEGGAAWTGTFQIALGVHERERRELVYHTLDARGFASQAVTVVGDVAMLRVPLLAERPGRAALLAELLIRERCLPLPDRGDGSARVMTIHTGASTVVGRCYGSQLRGRAREILDSLGETAIHWVTQWDDRWVNKISARLRYLETAEGPRLEVRNLTHYSQAKNDLRVRSSRRGLEVAAPGTTVTVPLVDQAVTTISVGEGSHRRELVTCRYLETKVGDATIPLVKTERTRFRFPPEDPDGLRMHYLGLWIPIPLEQLEPLLARSSEPLSVVFPEEAVAFWLRYRLSHQVIAVTSTEDLREGLLR